MIAFRKLSTPDLRDYREIKNNARMAHIEERDFYCDRHTMYTREGVDYQAAIEQVKFHNELIRAIDNEIEKR